MNAPARFAFAQPDPRAFFALFPPADDAPGFEIIPGTAVPQPYHDLLVHKRHMTVTQETYHGDRVNVRILDSRHADELYARKILLTLRSSGRVVQFGIPRIDLRYCSKAVREEILAGETPLGRILINHKVLRRIEPQGYYRVTPGKAMMGWFNLDKPRITYGRIGIIYCDEKPAIEVLEIVTPE